MKYSDYIADELIEPKIAEGMFSLIEDAILSLDEFPYRGSERKVGVYANKGYRQLFVKNFTIIYKVDEILRQVIVVTVRYSLLRLQKLLFENVNLRLF